MQKSKVVYAEDLDDLRKLYSMAIEAELNCEVIEFNCGNDLIDFVKTNQDVALVLSDYRMSNGSGADIYRYLKESGSRIPFGLLSSNSDSLLEEFSTFESDHPKNFLINKPIPIPELIKNISSNLLNPTASIPSEYVPVHVKRFEKLKIAPVDVFVKVDEHSFIRLSAKGELLSLEHYGKHQQKYGNYFYIPRNQYVQYLERCLEELKEKLEESGLVGSSLIEAQVTGLDLVHEIACMIGIEAKVIEMVDALCFVVINNFKGHSDNISLLFNSVFASGGFVIEHSILVAYVSCSIADRSGWNSSRIHEKLVIAALLHDLGLDDQLAKINKQTQILLGTSGMGNTKRILEHPKLISELVLRSRKFPSDVDLIIHCHHERPDGSGFPRKLTSSNTPPLACVFNTAEEFVSRFYSLELKKELMKEIVSSMEEEYSAGNYKKPLMGLKGLLGC